MFVKNKRDQTHRSDVTTVQHEPLMCPLEPREV